MKLIITRPRADALALAKTLQAKGHDPVLVPLLEIIPRKRPAIPDKPYQAICLTSANGALKIERLRDTPVLAVGEQSAAAARTAGYRQVSHHGGDVTGLSAHIAGNCRSSDGPLLYLSGATTSGDLEGRLRARGFDVDRIVTYDAVPTVPNNVAEVTAAAEGVLLYSPRTALLWIAAVEKAGVPAHIRRMTHYCLSSAVAARLPQSWPRKVADSPDETALLAALDRIREQE